MVDYDIKYCKRQTKTDRKFSSIIGEGIEAHNFQQADDDDDKYEEVNDQEGTEWSGVERKTKKYVYILPRPNLQRRFK